MAWRARASGDLDTVSVAERLLIHAPILLFALPIPVLLVLSTQTTGALRVVVLILAWWCASGAVMMAVDARSRRERYTRILALARHRGTGGHLGADLAGGLRQTICGLFLVAALRYRFGTASEYHRTEGVDA